MIEFGGWANLIERDVARLDEVLKGLLELAIGAICLIDLLRLRGRREIAPAGAWRTAAEEGVA